MALPLEERGKQDQPADQRREHARIGPSVGRLLDQREHGPGQAERAKHRTGNVDVSRRTLIALEESEQPERERDRDQVDGEDPSPARELHQSAAAERPDHRRDRRPRRPAADRARALLLGKPLHDQRQGAGHEQRAENALRGPRADQEIVGRRERAQQRAQSEPGQPDREDPAKPEQVTKRSSDQKQRRQRQQIGLDDPLLLGEPSVQI